MSAKHYKLVIFDLDGTLLDTSEGILNSVRYTIKQLGYIEPSPEVLLSFVGPRIQDSLQKIYGLQGNELNKAATIFRNQYKKGDVLLAKPYEGVNAVLATLKANGTHIAVATNKRQDFADELIEKYGFGQYVEVVCGTDMGGKLSKTDLIHMCINRFRDCSESDSVMIGDSSYDAIAAQEAGIDFMGVTYGFEFKTQSQVNRWENIGSVDKFRDLVILCQ